MKITEFNNYYKSYFPVGKGWRSLVTKLVEDIMVIDKEIEIVQVKEKFGGLRFYIFGGYGQINRLIEQAEIESFKTCEQCGTKENVETKGDWILTLCEKCRGDKIQR